MVEVQYVIFTTILYTDLLTDTKSSEKLLAITNNKALCGDIANLSTTVQTSSLESFHSLVNKFAQKQHAFSLLWL